MRGACRVLLIGVAFLTACSGGESGSGSTDAERPISAPTTSPSTTSTTDISSTPVSATTQLNTYVVVPAAEQLARPRAGVALPEPREDLTTHGGIAFGVYFAALTGPESAADYSAYSEGWAALRQVNDHLRDHFGGYFGPSTTTDCDVGAREALEARGLGNVVGYVVLHFPTLEDATAFAAGVDPPPLAVTEVRTMCRD